MRAHCAPMPTRRPLALVLALALTSASLLAPPASVALDGSEVLPDLGMLPPTNFSIQRRPRGDRWLRFDTVVVNMGPGSFDVEGRPDGATDGTLGVVQRVQHGNLWTEVATPARMFHAGDGHDHWHVRDLQDWTIARLDSPAAVLSWGKKTGFCFWDNYDYAATGPVAYHPNTTDACERRADETVPMGLSVGWGDRYPASIAFQYIDISTLGNGDYLVRLEADLPGPTDADGAFVEANETNNGSWATIRITRKSVTVLSAGTELPPAP